jgi:hypothetical protein
MHRGQTTKMNNALMQNCYNCKQRKPNKEKQFQSPRAEEQKTLDPFNKVKLLFLLTNLFISLSLFFIPCLFFELAVLDWASIRSS